VHNTTSVGLYAPKNAERRLEGFFKTHLIDIFTKVGENSLKAKKWSITHLTYKLYPLVID